MKNISRGDIVVTTLRGAEGGEIQDCAATNCRVCLVVQNEKGNAVSRTTIVAPISDGEKPSYLSVIVNVDANELGPLKKPSKIHLEQLRTLDRDIRVIDNLGQIPSSVMQRVNRALRVSLGL